MLSDNDNIALSARGQCPYSEMCYRRNPIHFREMSHPHLEKMVSDQLDEEIKLPENLDFPCTDRDLLADQLKILQSILRKRRGVTGPSKSSSSSSTPSTNGTGNEDLKGKVERNRQAAIARRQERLKELDKQASAITKGNSSNSHSEPSSSCADEVEIIEIDPSARKSPRSSLVDEIEVIEIDPPDRERLSSPLRTEKRSMASSGTKQSNNSKKLKSEIGNSSSQSRSTQGTSQQTGQGESCKRSGQSLFESYSTCSNSKSREQVRLKAIEMMKRSNNPVSIVEPGNFALKYALSAPYHCFLTRVDGIRETHDQPYSIVFSEILDRSLGEITCSLQTSFIVDVGWLCLQYLLAGQNPEMTILYGERADTEKLPPNIKLEQVTVPNAFGCHHSKLMILKYKDNGIRIVISTANLYSDDWETRTQMIWMSPHLPQLQESATAKDGESPTGFKKDFLRYLTRYNIPNLTEWLVHLRSADFSAINVAFVASVPGNHKSGDQDIWGHRKLTAILGAHATLPPDAPQWPIIAQCSSIGSLGNNYNTWLLKEIVASMMRETSIGLKSHPQFRFIYPSVKNYKNSLDCRHGSCCLPYRRKTHSKQEWIESYLYQWKATSTGRDRAIPHVKTYTRVSPDLKRIPWFVLTSANLSKAAWGYIPRGAHTILNYEAGVVFLPKFVTHTTTFPIVEEEPGVPVFRLPYDLPLTKYASDDKIFVADILEERN